MKQYETLQKLIKEDGYAYNMEEIATCLALTLEGYSKKSENAKKIKSKVTAGEWNSLVNGLMMSFLLTLHVSKLDYAEAIKYADTEGCIGAFVVTKNEA